ncbi:GNAT family N-acetyltransferase [Streptomyces sp. NPDC005498]|uniref:GNAT family N-acetyltransferase n=1 Tax=Streptomyces sp. NPDC005498 TaxID=3364717 RepID=UPI00368627CB
MKQEVSRQGSDSRAEEADLERVTANFRRYLMGWGRESRGEGCYDHYRSGLAQPQFNGVVRLRSLDDAEAALADARRRLAGVPWWWWAGPDSPEETPAVLTALGAVPLGPVPLMTLPLRDLSAPEEGPAGLRIEEVRDHDRLTHLVRTYSASMGVPSALERDVVEAEEGRPDNADVVRLAAVHNGEVVGTTVVMMAHEVAGIFLVHVAADYRRRGVGGALTLAALRAGRERGMRLAALCASTKGEPLYRRLGFSAVSSYHLFTSPAASHAPRGGLIH